MPSYKEHPLSGSRKKNVFLTGATGNWERRTRFWHSCYRESTATPLDQPYPDFDEFLTAIGEAGQRVSGINASEGAAGNISIYIGWQLEVRRRFPIAEAFALPVPAPALARGLVLVTGSGRRLRDIHHDRRPTWP